MSSSIRHYFILFMNHKYSVEYSILIFRYLISEMSGFYFRHQRYFLFVSLLCFVCMQTLLLPPGWDASPSQGYPPAACWVFTKRSQVPIYTPVWRETMWSNVSCLRKRHNGRDQGSNYRPSDREPDALTTKPPFLHYQQKPAVIEWKLRTSIYVTFQFWLG